ncbi:MAG: DUF4127 family protein [Armatimonadetes bacterium]|nr:DUF4127 family protein [Armatimonadota bacterium]
MKRWIVLGLALLSASAIGERILLIPLDSRPAAGQFAQMIGKMAGVRVELPPAELLGRFTTPGQSDAILDWLRDQDYSDVIATVVSTDMVAYGGLIASRVNDVPLETATRRISRLAIIRQRHPDTAFYGFSSITRLWPTATKAAAAWRLQLAKYEEMKDRYRRTLSEDARRSMENLQAKIPPIEIRNYEATRERNHLLQRTLLGLVRDKVLDYLVLGQDDAQPYGPHVPEQQQLRTLCLRYAINHKVYLCEGIDQHANVLTSRALLTHYNWAPKVRIVYSDSKGVTKVANYESKIVAQSLQDQLFASGATPAPAGTDYDYSLYLNTPDPDPDERQKFVTELQQEIDQGFPVAVADINLARDGTADPVLFSALWEKTRIMKLLAYAGWNTAGNTMGTAIPAANAYLLARRLRSDPQGREVAQREFLLHRIVNDYAYHKFTRPEAYRMIDSTLRASRDEIYDADFQRVQTLVQTSLTKHLQEYFKTQFLGRRFFAGTSQAEITGLEDVRIFLPWPRAFEVQIEFTMRTAPVGGG